MKNKYSKINITTFEEILTYSECASTTKEGNKVAMDYFKEHVYEN